MIETPSQQEIERIVRLVVQRVRDLMVAPAAVPDNPTEGVLQIDNRVLTLSDMPANWSGVKVIEVPMGCVVTPAVKDELRARAIVLQRVARGQERASNSGQSSLLLLTDTGAKAGLANQLRTVAKVQTIADDCQAACRAIGDFFANAGTACIWCSPRPFAAIHATANLPSVAAVQLSKLEQLSPAIEQVSPNTLILDDSEWTSSGVANLARAWTRSLAL